MTESEAEQTPRRRIILATMVRLERDGMDGLTVRSIAQEAGVNVAAVNYYFGSKERLLDEVQRLQLETGFSEPVGELDMLLAIPGLTPSDALQQFLAGFIRDMSRYPRTVEAYMHDALIRQDYSGAAFPALNRFLEDFLERTREMLAPGDDQAQRLSVAQLWSAILFLGLLPKATEPFSGGSQVQDEAIEQYAARLVEQFFPRA